MAKKVKPVSSGIDLSNLSLAELKALAIEANVKATELSEKERLQSLDVLQKSGELKSLKKGWASLGKEGISLTKKLTFNVTLPIQFTISPDGPYNMDDGYWSYGAFDEGDLFDYNFTGKLMKDHGLTNKQAAVFNSAIKEVAENAFDEIQDIVPEEIWNRYKEYAAKVNAFVQKANEAGLNLKDLE